MLRRFRLALVLIVVLGCHDSPTALDDTSPPAATVGLTKALVASRVLLDDPLIAALIAEADRPQVTRTMQQVSNELRVGDPETIGRTLHSAQRDLTQMSDDESMIARAALGLTLDALHKTLNDSTNADSGTTAALTNPTRSP